MIEQAEMSQKKAEASLGLVGWKGFIFQQI